MHIHFLLNVQETALNLSRMAEHRAIGNQHVIFMYKNLSSLPPSLLASFPLFIPPFLPFSKYLLSIYLLVNPCYTMCSSLFYHRKDP